MTAAPSDQPGGDEELREVLLALRRARDEAQRRALENTVLLEVLETLLRPLPPFRLIALTLRALRRIVPFEHALILEGQADGALRLVYGPRSGRRGALWPGGALFERVLAGNVVNLLDLRMVPDWRRGASPLAQLGGGGLLVPLLYGETRAVLVLIAATVGGFGEEEYQTARRFAVVARQTQASLEARRLKEQADALARAKEEAERARRESERREQVVSAILNAIPVGVFLKGGDGRYRFANRETARMIGRGSEPLAGCGAADLLPPDLAAAVEADERRLLDGAGVVERELVHPRDLIISLTKSLVDIDGERLIVGTALDITQRKEAERAILESKNAAEAALGRMHEAQRQLVEAEKMAALGQLVAGVAHEINTPLGNALLCSSNIEERTADLRALLGAGQIRRADLEAYLEGVEEMAHFLGSNLRRADDLVRSFKEVSVSQSSDEHRRFLLSPYLTDALRNLSVRLRREGVELGFACPDDLEVEGYPGAFSHLVTNLAMNAMEHAFPAGGGCGREKRIHLTVERLGADRLELRFADNGTGIPEDLRAKIFDPFFTTARGRGNTGLGLHIVFNLVNHRLGGSIAVESEPGAGTTFILRCPLRVAPAPSAPSALDVG